MSFGIDEKKHDSGPLDGEFNVKIVKEEDKQTKGAQERGESSNDMVVLHLKVVDGDYVGRIMQDYICYGITSSVEAAESAKAKLLRLWRLAGHESGSPGKGDFHGLHFKVTCEADGEYTRVKYYAAYDGQVSGPAVDQLDDDDIPF